MTVIASPHNVVWSTASSNSDTPFNSSVPPPDGSARFISEQTWLGQVNTLLRTAASELDP
jgi:hypothetical protein